MPVETEENGGKTSRDASREDPRSAEKRGGSVAVRSWKTGSAAGIHSSSATFSSGVFHSSGGVRQLRCRVISSSVRASSALVPRSPSIFSTEYMTVEWCLSLN